MCAAAAAANSSAISNGHHLPLFVRSMAKHPHWGSASELRSALYRFGFSRATRPVAAKWLSDSEGAGRVCYW